MFPVNIEVLPNLQVLFVEMIPQLNNIGFKVEEFGKDSFVIRAVPAFIKEKNVEIIINNILDDINDMDFNPKFLLQRFDEVIKIMACRCAYKAGDKIEKKEFESIMNDLLKLEESYTCPHGRPIIVKFNNKELEKMFLRKK